ncbi:hypothetical protein WDR79_004827 [Citrobacter freundii]
MPGIIENANLQPTHKCSFCEKTNNDVSVMIAGPGVCICDICVLLCVGVIFKQKGKEEADESRS